MIGIRIGWRWRSGRRPGGWLVWPGLSSMCAACRWVWLVIYQRADGSAHVIAAVRAGDGWGGSAGSAEGEEAEAADVLAAVGVWVIPVSGAEVEGGGVAAQWFWAAQPGRGVRAARCGDGSETSARCVRAGGGGSRRECGEFAGEVGEGSGGVKRRKVDAAAVVGAVSESPGDGGSEVRTPTDQAAQQDPDAERKRKRKERTERSRARKVAADRVVVLEELAEQGPLLAEEAVELAELQPKVAQQKQEQDRNARHYRSGKAAADRFAVLEALKERGR